MTITEITEKLKQPFPAADHEIRELPGGKQWVYIRWQKIRSRLHQACPDWQVSYSDPNYLDEYCYVRCKLTIAGISREAVGNAKIQQLSSKGNDMSRGTPIERAIADAFKNAAESFGVGAYLDDQEFVIRHLCKEGDMRWHKLKQKM
ncbi:hypothetical protein Syn7502_02823 [Synechococcus sp. PCC 7502]|uniref:Rad52/Rad22 family DNA repair protein n=1 Tax=Synechococcus sp. PCC 7502 TaxID=1173263 RepID=UPI00029FD4FC|nr:Rad52/Rad22 family DNA repair protein [Synechococcus sp. PCC 7502]AFY74760.1 hypothetical protein Syn7502_02823 [Synechococcus sp. PCC 7502]